MKTLIAASLLILAACAPVVQPTPAASPTVTSTVTPTPTVKPTSTATQLPPTQTPDVAGELMPDGQPASEWMGIPIMPDAISGEGDPESYVFTIKATPQQIQQYYQLELGKLGWRPFAQGSGDASLVLMFIDDASATLTISIISKEEDSLVLLVK